jgi:hypothetical protein
VKAHSRRGRVRAPAAEQAMRIERMLHAGVQQV